MWEVVVVIRLWSQSRKWIDQTCWRLYAMAFGFWDIEQKPFYKFGCNGWIRELLVLCRVIQLFVQGKHKKGMIIAFKWWNSDRSSQESSYLVQTHEPVLEWQFLSHQIRPIYNYKQSWICLPSFTLGYLFCCMIEKP